MSPQGDRSKACAPRATTRHPTASRGGIPRAHAASSLHTQTGTGASATASLVSCRQARPATPVSGASLSIPPPTPAGRPSPGIIMCALTGRNDTRCCTILSKTRTGRSWDMGSYRPVRARAVPPGPPAITAVPAHIGRENRVERHRRGVWQGPARCAAHSRCWLWMRVLALPWRCPMPRVTLL